MSTTRYGKNGDPLNEVLYEWVLEYMDEHGDCHDLEHGDTLADVWDDYTGFTPRGDIVKVDMALQRRAGNNDDGETERGYAYVHNEEGLHGKQGLELEFCCGHKVPAQYLVQVAKRLNP